MNRSLDQDDKFNKSRSIAELPPRIKIDLARRTGFKPATSIVSFLGQVLAYQTSYKLQGDTLTLPIKRLFQLAYPHIPGHHLIGGGSHDHICTPIK